MLASFSTSSSRQAFIKPRNFPFPGDASPRKYFLSQPAIPVLSSTRLELDLLLSARVLDLDAILTLLQSDVGACLQVWRSAALGRRRCSPKPATLSDCIDRLGRSGLRSATRVVLSASAGDYHPEALQFWERSRLCAELTAALATHISGIPPGLARVSGLLHAAGKIPSLLGWDVPGIDLCNFRAVARAMFVEWELPLPQFTPAIAHRCQISPP